MPIQHRAVRRQRSAAGRRRGRTGRSMNPATASSMWAPPASGNRPTWLPQIMITGAARGAARSSRPADRSRGRGRRCARAGSSRSGRWCQSAGRSPSSRPSRSEAWTWQNESPPSSTNDRSGLTGPAEERPETAATTDEVGRIRPDAAADRAAGVEVRCPAAQRSRSILPLLSRGSVLDRRWTEMTDWPQPATPPRLGAGPLSRRSAASR